MKFSWTSLKISIAGAKLSHLVQKDKIWDPGSMIEQARIIFYLIQKAKRNGNLESLRKCVSSSCFEKLQMQFNETDSYRIDGRDADWQKGNALITELAVISVQPGNKNRPDMFTALIRGYERPLDKEKYDESVSKDMFSLQWSFVRRGDWWMLDSMKLSHTFL